MPAYEPNSRHLREVLIVCFNMKKSVAEAHRMLSNTYVREIQDNSSRWESNEPDVGRGRTNEGICSAYRIKETCTYASLPLLPELRPYRTYTFRAIFRPIPAIFTQLPSAFEQLFSSELKKLFQIKVA
ncbi:hypothetical protein TNCV_2327371 [Trichonephila clavipes]|nr:hypothetical protein TNCV_2327371 [Trichonephila clavipes]